MNVTLRAFADYREIVGREMQLSLAEGKTVGEVIAGLCGRYPPLQKEMFDTAGKLKEFINIFVNGRNIAFLDDMATPLANGDVVSLFPPVAGG